MLLPTKATKIALSWLSLHFGRGLGWWRCKREFTTKMTPKLQCNSASLPIHPCCMKLDIRLDDRKTEPRKVIKILIMVISKISTKINLKTFRNGCLYRLLPQLYPSESTSLHEQGKRIWLGVIQRAGYSMFGAGHWVFWRNLIGCCPAWCVL